MAELLLGKSLVETKAKKMLEVTCRSSYESLEPNDLIKHVLVKKRYLSKEDAKVIERKSKDLREFLFCLPRDKPVDIVFIKGARDEPSRYIMDQVYKNLNKDGIVVVEVDLKKYETSRSWFGRPLTSSFVSTIGRIASPFYERISFSLRYRELYENILKRSGFEEFNWSVNKGHYLLVAKKLV